MVGLYSAKETGKNRTQANRGLELSAQGWMMALYIDLSSDRW